MCLGDRSRVEESLCVTTVLSPLSCPVTPVPVRATLSSRPRGPRVTPRPASPVPVPSSPGRLSASVLWEGVAFSYLHVHAQWTARPRGAAHLVCVPAVGPDLGDSARGPEVISLSVSCAGPFLLWTRPCPVKREGRPGCYILPCACTERGCARPGVQGPAARTLPWEHRGPERARIRPARPLAEACPVLVHFRPLPLPFQSSPRFVPHEVLEGRLVGPKRAFCCDLVPRARPSATPDLRLHPSGPLVGLQGPGCCCAATCWRDGRLPLSGRAAWDPGVGSPLFSQPWSRV